MHLIASSSAWVSDQCVTWLPNPSTGTEAEWNPGTPSAVGWPSWIIYVYKKYIYIIYIYYIILYIYYVYIYK